MNINSKKDKQFYSLPNFKSSKICPLFFLNGVLPVLFHFLHIIARTHSLWYCTRESLPAHSHTSQKTFQHSMTHALCGICTHTLTTLLLSIDNFSQECTHKTTGQKKERAEKSVSSLGQEELFWPLSRLHIADLLFDPANIFPHTKGKVFHTTRSIWLICRNNSDFTADFIIILQ